MGDLSATIRRVNLNLLPVLVEILHTRNVTQAAKALCLTQSATSGCLKRLREMFDDELLVQRGREMVLTARARELLPQLEAFLAQAAALVDSPAFDPSRDKTRFKVATADWIGALLISKMNAVTQSAPNITVEFADGNLKSMVHDLQQGFIDLLIGPKEVLEWSNLNVHGEDPDYAFEPCFQDRLVAIESCVAPTPEIESDLQAYLNHPHITFSLHPQMHASLEQTALNEAGLSQRDLFVVPQFSVLPYLVSVTGAIAVVPSSLAEQFASILPIRVFEPPLLFRPINLIMVWSRARKDDPAQQWFRAEVLKAFRGRSA